jgi:hypothetical protein
MIIILIQSISFPPRCRRSQRSSRWCPLSVPSWQSGSLCNIIQPWNSWPLENRLGDTMRLQDGARDDEIWTSNLNTTAWACTCEGQNKRASPTVDIHTFCEVPRLGKPPDATILGALFGQLYQSLSTKSARCLSSVSP